MAAEDYFDPYDEPDEAEAQEVRCQFCGERGLQWHTTSWGPRLYDEEGECHECPPSDSDEFNVEPD